jgi:hypothetical protein
MFNRSSGDNSGPPPTPQADGPGPMPMPTIRVFKVVRRSGYTEDGGDVLETLTVSGHALAVADDNRTVFQTWRIDPVIGPQLQVTRVMTHIIDVEDVTPSVAEPSRLIS